MLKRRSILCWTGVAILVSALAVSSTPQAGMGTPPGVQASDCPPFYFGYQSQLRNLRADLDSNNQNLRALAADRIEVLNMLLQNLGSLIKDCVNGRFAKSCVYVAKAALEYSDYAGKKQPDYVGAQMFLQRACDLGDKGSCKKAQDAAKKISQSK